ncbi:hypothetical protein J2Q11_08720 [Tenacibaculum finnmarkense genomovar finnmarkense]|uniref:hypothetical protein n=1 Tax=Tenacibaculum finnmarkense TaxID=2781243 RepID=UPI001558B5E6|nr:hypothetical protein [Tenacibaculum finnmarkense]MBE7649308.1 hypothetical protein [Tenacibaculum finnmarkense genomovar ulcerans]MBE7688457.1 hypothetical protein [Tenacibaculum finnmarkense genomovar ulcerans]MCD8430388.1 hypothetical protein [Tenacibaculum finnmarkense genomovar ulcerans]MCG8212920.1 hypothetical protein [Tenacibaculum finnmarkense genomovar finnmarkense]MCG8231209.1 hypothetical protein [Tenacibaculum finnmarkense genomovar finnmarkense]
MKEELINMVNKYSGYVIGGLIGAIVHRIRNTMSFVTFLGVLFISAFIGFCVGVIMRNYLNATDEVIFVACSISGVFAKDILTEIQQVIAFISIYIKTKLKIEE